MIMTFLVEVKVVILPDVGVKREEVLKRCRYMETLSKYNLFASFVVYFNGDDAY